MEISRILRKIRIGIEFSNFEHASQNSISRNKVYISESGDRTLLGGRK